MVTWKMSRPETIEDFVVRYERLIKIINLIITDMYNPLIDYLNKEEYTRFKTNINSIENQFHEIGDDDFVNHQNLNDLAKAIQRFAKSCYERKENIGVEELSWIYSYEYIAREWMIRINNEDTWYTGR